MPKKLPAKRAARRTKMPSPATASIPSATLAPPPPGSPQPDVEPVLLRGPTGEIPVRQLGPVDRIYTYWTYVLANRTRFSDDARAALQERAAADLASLGMDDFASVLPATVLEVSIPFEKESTLWAPRVCPWEGLLRFATKTHRRADEPLTIVRELRRRSVVAANAADTPQSLLFVVSAPGRLDECFDFTIEERLVANALQIAPEDRKHYLRLHNPSRRELAEAVAQFRPDVIHLAGVDAHQAAALLRQPENLLRHDGYILRGPDDQPESIDAEPLADALTADGTHAPRLVCFNFYNSGARLAALAVAKGARSAVGFQDTIDDRAAEQFFVNLYTIWRRTNWENLLGAFTASHLPVAASSENRTSGDVILWNDRSVFETPRRVEMADLGRLARKALNASQPWLHAIVDKLVESARSLEATAPTLAAPRVAAAAPAVSPTTAPRTADDTIAPFPPPATPPDPPARSAAPSSDGGARPPTETGTPREPRLRFIIRPLPSLNYSLLHNQSAVFDRFQIEADEADLPLDIEWNVQLYSGDSSFPARGHHRLLAPLTHLHTKIYVPLLAPVLRARHEGIGTALTCQVTCGGKTHFLETLPVRLLPADEWVDTPEDRCWLPSFVLPRDPAVQQIVGSAKPYLQALTDDSGAGFDGYQRVDDATDAAGVVELQARALWSALLYELPVSYINPPPTYTSNSQRIRTPSQIMEERLATCLDLALLFTASLEYLGIMPVMFLIHGHAFPGYWRSPEAYARFWKFGNLSDTGSTGVANSSTTPPAPRKAWMIEGDGGLAEIMRAIQSGGLVPIETTAITRLGSFREAQETGFKNLLTRWGFDAMVDLQKARELGVTPLPLLHKDA